MIFEALVSVFQCSKWNKLSLTLSLNWTSVLVPVFLHNRDLTLLTEWSPVSVLFYSFTGHLVRDVVSAMSFSWARNLVRLVYHSVRWSHWWNCAASRQSPSGWGPKENVLLSLSLQNISACFSCWRRFSLEGWLIDFGFFHYLYLLCRGHLNIYLYKKMKQKRLTSGQHFHSSKKNGKYRFRNAPGYK